jgi:hypothetical protein
VTTEIPDSWELPSYLAGDVIPFGRRQGPKVPPAAPTTDWGDMARRLGDIEPYDPEIHGRGPGELYNQDALDSLENAGFSPLERNYWHRPVLNSSGEQIGSHFIAYHPGFRNPEGALTPWHLMTDPDEIGQRHGTLRGALRVADADAANMLSMEKQARVYLRRCGL